MRYKAEPIQNIVYVCHECTNKNKELIQKDLHNILKTKNITHIKKRFVDTAFEKAEHMWIKISYIDWEKEIVYGILDNDPVIVKCIAYNDSVEIKFEEIINVYPFI